MCTLLLPNALQGSLVDFPITAKLTSSDPDGIDGDIIENMFSKLFVPGWGVEWISITTSTGDMFSCPFNGWLKVGEGNSLTVNCTSSGDYCHLQVTCVTNIARMFVKFVLSFHLAHARVCQILGNSGKAFKSQSNKCNKRNYFCRIYVFGLGKYY